MNVLNLLSSNGFIVLNKYLINVLGIVPTIMLGELASEMLYHENSGTLEDGFFYSTIERIEENTTLSRYQQDKAIKILVSKGLLIYKTAGMPAKRYFKLSEEKLTNLFVKNSQTSLRKTNKQDCEKLTPNNNREKNNREIKIDNITPITPKRKSIKDINLDTLTELIGGYNFSQDIFSKLVEWYTYKAEQKKTITPTGMKTQLNKVNSMIASIGEDKVIYVLDESMANNYQGMIWDLANKGAKQSKKTNIEGWFEA